MTAPPEPPELSRTFRCLVCSASGAEPVFQEGGLAMMRCRHCRHLFSSFAAVPDYDGFWGTHVPDGNQFYWSHARARMHQDFCTALVMGRSGRLLDMGCGLGFFLASLARYAGWEGYGCEISDAAVRYARSRLGLSNVMRSRLDDAPFPPDSFDVVTMWDVLDHLPQPDAVLRRCYALLKANGVLFIRTPHGPVQLFRARLKRLIRRTTPHLTYLQLRHHVHLYSPSSIGVLLKRNGFSRVEFSHLHPIASDRGPVARALKNGGFNALRALAALSRNRLNLDNLFVMARKALCVSTACIEPTDG
jgi:SAM-dependent methyltransferase